MGQRGRHGMTGIKSALWMVRPHTDDMTASPIFLVLLLAAGALSQSLTCDGRCGVNDGVSTCQCNSLCESYGDCCTDYVDICYSCQDRCGEDYLYSKPCQCNVDCPSYGNCCSDFADLCDGTVGGGVTDTDLRNITELMYAAEVNSVYSQLVLDYQGMGSSGDLAPGPLFVSVPPSALSGPTISLMMAVQDNYYPDVALTEDQDTLEIDEQNAFLDAMMATDVMQLAESFLLDKNLLTGTLRDKLDEIWFTLYDRGTLASSGFEHVFVGELKGGVSGFHNWVNFQKEEFEGDLNYLSYMDTLPLGAKGEVIMHRFEWLGNTKNIGSMFVGTSPELEMATYTVCFLARPDQLCPVQMAGQQFQVQTWTIYGNLVGSAYPDI